MVCALGAHCAGGAGWGTSANDSSTRSSADTTALGLVHRELVPLLRDLHAAFRSSEWLGRPFRPYFAIERPWQGFIDGAVRAVEVRTCARTSSESTPK